MTKSLSNFEIKPPNCTILFIIVFELPFIDCILSKNVGFDQLWTAVQQKLVTTAKRKLVFFKMPNTFAGLLSKTVVIFYCDHMCRDPYRIYFPNSARIQVTDQNEKFLLLFTRILANLANFDIKMFCPGNFGVKIVRNWKQVNRKIFI